MGNSEDKDIDGHVGVLVTVLLVLFLVWLFWLNNGVRIVHEVLVGTLTKSDAKTTSSVLAELGQVGDSFGALNTLFAGMAGAFVAWAGYLQHLQLRQVRRAYDAERLSRKKQEFESIFFKMLELSRDLAGRVEDISFQQRETSTPKPNGFAALDARAAAIADKVKSSWQSNPEFRASVLVISYKGYIYNKQPSALGPYFRLLFQIFQTISEAGLKPEDERRYANIARGQLSEGAVLLLALNGLTAVGHDFIPLIERFGLLEHMHRRYRQYYEEALRTGYRASAFLGSAERKAHPIEVRPLNPPEFFESHPRTASLVPIMSDIQY